MKMFKGRAVFVAQCTALGAAALMCSCDSTTNNPPTNDATTDAAGDVRGDVAVADSKDAGGADVAPDSSRVDASDAAGDAGGPDVAPDATDVAVVDAADAVKADAEAGATADSKVPADSADGIAAPDSADGTAAPDSADGTAAPDSADTLSTDTAVADSAAPVDTATADTFDAGGACVTTISSFTTADAGAGPVAKLLFGFDAPATDGGVTQVSAWQTFLDGAVTPTLSWIGNDGRVCGGALSASSSQVNKHNMQVFHNFTNHGGAQDWTGYSKLHVWVKVVAADYADIKGLNPRIESDGWSKKLYSGWTAGTAFNDGGWHDVVIPLAANGTYVPSSVDSLQLELQVQVASGAAALVDVTMLVDSIWIE